LAFFSKTNVMINFFSKFGFVSRQKRQFFRWIFRRKYFKNHNIGPRSFETSCSEKTRQVLKTRPTTKMDAIKIDTHNASLSANKLDSQVFDRSANSLQTYQILYIYSIDKQVGQPGCRQTNCPYVFSKAANSLQTYQIRYIYSIGFTEGVRR
jgi:hypothetical protein